MNNIKFGDFVYFSVSDKDTEKLFNESGIVLNISNDIISIVNGAYTNTIYNIVLGNVRPISDKQFVIDEINKYYNKKIEEYESKIKSVKRADYKEDIVKKYNSLKTEIINTAKHMIKSKDDYDFEKKLKAICEKKKQIFSIECDELTDARKYNGRIKYKIRELEQKRDRDIKNLDLSIDNLKRALNN